MNFDLINIYIIVHNNIIIMPQSCLTIYQNLSLDFLNIMNLCIQNNNNSDLIWIYDMILENYSLLEVARLFIEKHNYNGIFLSDTSCAIFDAFIQYKENGQYDETAASYLKDRCGVLDKIEIYDSQGEILFYFPITVKFLIKELDGDNFCHWLNLLAEEGDRMMYE